MFDFRKMSIPQDVLQFLNAGYPGFFGLKREPDFENYLVLYTQRRMAMVKDCLLDIQWSDGRRFQFDQSNFQGVLLMDSRGNKHSRVCLFQVVRAEILSEYAPQEGRREARRAIEFLERHCYREIGAETATADIYDRYCVAVDEGSRLSTIDFSRVLSKYVQGWEMISQVKRVNGEERRGYRGVRLL